MRRFVQIKVLLTDEEIEVLKQMVAAEELCGTWRNHAGLIADLAIAHRVGKWKKDAALERAAKLVASAAT